MLITELIEKKRDGFAHTEEEIRFIIDGVVDHSIPDYQLTAWMMAVCCRGMTDDETAWLTMAMRDSGDTVDLSCIDGFKVDKHSTGGVGDTTTLITAPLTAACGAKVAKMSGRALAHSGGTLDKLESIPGVCVEQPLDEFIRIVRKTGVCVIGQTGSLDPADKRMYALRDVSGTVKSIPLIASSIMSKKLAAGTDAIVLDVKTGDGAFMETVEEAEELARTMVSIGEKLGKRTIALITDMNRPLGMAIGNGLEVREAVEALTGKLSLEDPLMKVSLALGEQMLIASSIATDSASAEAMLKTALESGEGFLRFRAMIEELGGDTRYVDDPHLLVRVNRIVPVYPKRSGFIGHIDTKQLGMAALCLGAGRESANDAIDHAVGIQMQVRYGDFVNKDEPLAMLYVNESGLLDTAIDKVTTAISISDEKPDQIPLIYKLISK